MDGFYFFLYLVFMSPFMMPPLGLLLVSVGAVLLAVPGSSRYVASGGRASLARPWFVLGVTLFALEALLAAPLVVASLRDRGTWPVVLVFFSWVVLQDVVVAVCLLRAVRARRSAASLGAEPSATPGGRP